MEFDNQAVLIAFDKYDKIWFSYKDILILLNYKSKGSLNDLEIDDKYMLTIGDIEGIHFPKIISNLQNHTKMINESGLFEVLSISKKPLAKLFRKKYVEEIMPLIIKIYHDIFFDLYEIKKDT